MVARHDCEGQVNPARGMIGAASFSAHSVLDGFAMGVAFQANATRVMNVSAPLNWNNLTSYSSGSHPTLFEVRTKVYF